MSRTNQQPPYHLKIGDTPIHPYCNVPFTIPVFLLDDKEQLKCGVEVVLEVKLYYEEKPLRDCEKSLLEVNSSADQLIIGRDGRKEIEVTIKALSMNHDNRKFVVYVSGKTSSGTYIQPASTKGMLSIRYRLVIEDKAAIPDVWYKDEGGREKCMEMNVHLLDSNSKCVSDKRIHVKLILLYENGNVVPKQDILKVNNESRTYIDDKGQVSIKFRIEEVSRSHQKQLFMIQASPDTAQYPLSNDVSSDVSNPIEVRSKRNNTKTGRGRPDFELPAAKIPHDMNLSMVADSIMRWRSLVMGALKEIQWTLVGYDRDVTGAPDYSKPLFAMKNPEAYINAITQEYNLSLDDCISYLNREAENQNRRNVLMEQASESTVRSHPSIYNGQSYPYAMTPSISAGGGGGGIIMSTNASDHLTSYAYYSDSAPGDLQHSQLHGQLPASSLPLHHSHDNDNDWKRDTSYGSVMSAFSEDQVGYQSSSLTAVVTNEGQMDDRIFYVHSTQYCSSGRQTNLGFPVYDFSKHLIGFCRDVLNGSGVTVLNFHSIYSNDDMKVIPESEIQYLRNLLELDLKNGSNTIFDLNNFGSVDQMLEEVLVTHWASQIH